MRAIQRFALDRKLEIDFKIHIWGLTLSLGFQIPSQFWGKSCKSRKMNEGMREREREREREIERERWEREIERDGRERENEIQK